MAEHAAGRELSRGRAFVALVGMLGATACGLRTDPLFTGSLTSVDSEGLTGGATGDVVIDPNRMGACEQPFEIPIENTTIQGTLPDGYGSLYGGWCGADDGVEDVYRLVPFYDVDIRFTFRPESTELDPTLRVQTEACGEADVANVCAKDVIDNPHHFLARNGSTYYVTIDSRQAGEGGAYAFDVVFGDPGIDACPLHPERVTQSPGAAFVWGNDFTPGQGEVDGYCGGPGKENLFQLDASYAGAFTAVAEGDGGFVPVLSFRTGCGGVTELGCTAAGDTGLPGIAELYGFIPGPGTYYLAVDQATVEAGSYSLRVDFE